MKKILITFLLSVCGTIAANAQIPPPEWFDQVGRVLVEVVFHGEENGYNDEDGNPVFDCLPDPEKICFIVWMDDNAAPGVPEVGSGECLETADEDVYVRHYHPTTQATSLAHYDHMSGVLDNGDCHYYFTND